MATLITGGNGFIGWRAAQRLLERGESVVLVDTSPPNAQVDELARKHGERLTVARGDVLATGNMGELAARNDVDRVLHLAYLLGAESNADPGLATRVNLVGTANVLDLARLVGVRRVVLASSIAVYGNDAAYGPEQLPLREDAPTWIASPVPLYGGGKLYMEQLAALYRLRFGIEAVCLRPSIVYGPGRRTGSTGFVVAVAEDAAHGHPVEIPNGDAAMSLVYVEDVADQVVGLLDVPAERFGERWVFNSGGDTCTMRQYADAVRDVVPDARITIGSGTETDLSGLAASVSGAAIDELLGPTRRHSPVTEGVRALVEAARR